MTDKPRLIDADKLLKWMFSREESMRQGAGGRSVFYQSLYSSINDGDFDPDPPQQPDIQPGDRVNYIGTQFPFLENVKVNHIEIHCVGRVAALAYGDEIYKVYVNQVQKVEGEES